MHGFRRTAICAVILVSLALLAVASASAASITSFAWYGNTTNGGTPSTGLAAGIGTADLYPYCVGTNIVINGQGFVSDGGVSAVTIGGKPARYFKVGSDSQLFAGVGAGAVTGTIQVTTPAGVATSSSTVSIQPCQTTNGVVALPKATGIKPTKAKGGAKIEVFGSGFLGTTGVSVGGINAAFSLPSDYNVYFILPKALANGKQKIVFTGLAGVTHTLTVTINKTS
jgi:hypothetical protein